MTSYQMENCRIDSHRCPAPWGSPYIVAANDGLACWHCAETIITPTNGTIRIRNVVFTCDPDGKAHWYHCNNQWRITKPPTELHTCNDITTAIDQLQETSQPTHTGDTNGT